MRFFIHLSYDGTNYYGWQRQSESTSTVQGSLEKALAQIFKKEIVATGCGRTDAGVHASQYVCQINLDEAPSFDLKFRLNKTLPKDISVFEIIEVNKGEHCRHGVSSRTYDYFIHWEKDPFLSPYSSYYEVSTLDAELMKKATILLLNTKDFKAVCKQAESHNNTLCDIRHCEIFINEKQSRLRFTITADRFLRGMVRICVFFLMEVGSGKISLVDFAKILKQQIAFDEKVPAYPNGLFLSGIEYPFLQLNEDFNRIKLLRTGLE